MTIIAMEGRRGMHRHSDEIVAAVVLAATAELRRQLARGKLRQVGSPAWDEADPELQAMAGRVRIIRTGVLPRAQYEEDSGPDDPSYEGLPASRRDEDQLAWFVTQALTGTGN